MHRIFTSLTLDVYVKEQDTRTMLCYQVMDRVQNLSTEVFVEREPEDPRILREDLDQPYNWHNVDRLLPLIRDIIYQDLQQEEWAE